jgi:hypothetical protein
MADDELKPVMADEAVEGSSEDVKPQTKAKSSKKAKPHKKKAKSKGAPIRLPRPFPMLPLESALRIPRFSKKRMVVILGHLRKLLMHSTEVPRPQNSIISLLVQETMV